MLHKLKEKRQVSPAMSYEVWKAMFGVVPMLAVEVIVSTTGKNFVLTYRQEDRGQAKLAF